MKKSIFTCFSICLIAISCSKKTDVTPTPDPGKYLNITTGSRFTYEVITNPGTAGATSVIDTVTVSAIDTTVEQGTANERVYRILNHTNGNTSEYSNISGNDYYRFQNLPVNNIKIQELYLKDNAAVGTSWSQNLIVPVAGLGDVPVVITNSITEKGISKTVNGITYADVINVKTDISTSLLPGGIVTDIKSYYARKIGLIQGDYKIQISLASVDINSQTLIQTADIH